jgi:hypothetical protein
VDAAKLVILLQKAPVLVDDFSTYANDAALQAVWAALSGVTQTLDAGRMLITNGAGGGSVQRAFKTVPGKAYDVTVDLTGGTTSIDCAFGATSGGSELGNTTTVSAGAGPTTRTLRIVATGITTFARPRTGSLAGGTAYVDNMIVRPV